MSCDIIDYAVCHIVINKYDHRKVITNSITKLISINPIFIMIGHEKNCRRRACDACRRDNYIEKKTMFEFNKPNK